MNGSITRRAAVVGLVAGDMTVVLGACTAAPVSSTPTVALPVAPTNVGLVEAGTPSTQGNLFLAVGFDFPARIDALKDSRMLAFGMLECLTRQSTDNKLEPWLAESVTNEMGPVRYSAGQGGPERRGRDEDRRWDAAMKSNNTISASDPLYEYNRLLARGDGDSVGNYTNPAIEGLLTQLRSEIDPDKRQTLSKQVQAIVKDDVPMVFLAALPVTTGFRKGKLLGYVPNPSDSYLLKTDLTVA